MTQWTKQQQWKIDYEVRRRSSIHTPTLDEALRAERAASPAPPTEAERERRALADALRTVRDEAMAAGVQAGLAVGKVMERNRR